MGIVFPIIPIAICIGVIVVAILICTIVPSVAGGRVDLIRRNPGRIDIVIGPPTINAVGSARCAFCIFAIEIRVVIAVVITVLIRAVVPGLRGSNIDAGWIDPTRIRVIVNAFTIVAVIPPE